MHDLKTIQQMNKNWEEKEVYKDVARLRNINRDKRITDLKEMLQDEMREQVREIKAANQHTTMRLNKDEIDRILTQVEATMPS